MSDLEARQARPATPPMTKHHGPVVPPGREMRPKPIKASKAVGKERRARVALSDNAKIVLEQLNRNGPATGAELEKRTGRSSSSVSRAVEQLREAGEIVSERAKGGRGGAIKHTSVDWQVEQYKAESRRQQAVEQNGPLGYPDTENDLEDDEPETAEVVFADNRYEIERRFVEDDEPDPSMFADDIDAKQSRIAESGRSSLADIIEHTQEALRYVRLELLSIETDKAAAIQPLPADDYRIEAMRRLVPLVSDDIGEAINDLIEHVTGGKAA